ncbi:MAG TPA: glycosyltransferase [Rhodanobacteraceae bacterium]|nr:glycosyltransferase [Rhodanobacteraceae bacterium]
MTDLAVVVPVYNEVDGLSEFHRRLRVTLAESGMSWSVLYVDDGSRDGTWGSIEKLAAADESVRALRLSRNFGKEAALTAGLDHCDADAVVVIDADLQDPPELIPQLVAGWREGFDVVYATRDFREGESRIKRVTASAFYHTLERMSDIPIPRDTGDFRLMSRRAVGAMRQLRERQRFMKGLFAWIGYPQKAVHYRRQPRARGSSKWNYWRLWNLAIEGITSFSVVPLRLATWLGLATAGLAFAYGIYVLLKAVLWGDPVRGYPSLMLVILLLGGVQLLALGVIGEYLGRLYAESKQRPLYVIEAACPPQRNRD